MPIRILVNLHICLLFSLLVHIAASPFLKDHYLIAKRKNLIDFVMGTQTGALAERNKQRFTTLSSSRKRIIEAQAHRMLTVANRSSLEKWLTGCQRLTQISSFALVWAVLSFTLCLLLRRNRKGLKEAACLLPLLALSYGIENRLLPPTPPPPDAALFPSEQHLLQTYGPSLLPEQKQTARILWQQCWEQYLIANWAKNKKDGEKTAIVEDATYQFQLARLEQIQKFPLFSQARTRQNPWLAIAFFAWSVFFAISVFHSEETFVIKEEKKPQFQ